MITFRLVCRVSALVCLVLFGIFVIAPDAYVASYGAPADAGVVFLGNRTAPMFLGLATVCWLLQDQTEPEVRTALSLAMIVTYGGIATTGIWAYLQGDATSTILLAAGGELALAVAFAYTAWTKA